MSYSAKYTDENGVERMISVTEEDSNEALINDYNEIMRRFNPEYVIIRKVRTRPGEALHLKVTVNAPTHYLDGPKDTKPKNCSSMTVDIICYPGYPLRAIRAYYDEHRYLASLNVFSSGSACIDQWIPMTSSLVTVTEKLVKDMTHNTEVTRRDSQANSSIIDWYDDCVAKGKFPTIEPRLLYAPEQTALPPRRTVRRAPEAPPPMPRRRR